MRFLRARPRLVISWHGPYLTPESRVIALGLPRYGKTTFIRDVLTADAERVIYHDVKRHDYYAPGRLPLTIDELEDRQYLLSQQYCRLVILSEYNGDPKRFADELRRTYQLLKQYGSTPGEGYWRGFVFVSDESGAAERRADNEYNEIYTRGNSFGIVPISMAQKATLTTLSARTTCSDCYAWGQHHPKELKVMEECYGDLFAIAVSQQKKGHPPIHWSDLDRERWWSSTNNEENDNGG